MLFFVVLCYHHPRPTPTPTHTPELSSNLESTFYISLALVKILFANLFCSWCLRCLGYQAMPSYRTWLVLYSLSTFGKRGNTHMTRGKFNLNEAATSKQEPAQQCHRGTVITVRTLRIRHVVPVVLQQLLAAVTPHRINRINFLAF